MITGRSASRSSAAARVDVGRRAAGGVGQRGSGSLGLGRLG